MDVFRADGPTLAVFLVVVLWVLVCGFWAARRAGFGLGFLLGAVAWLGIFSVWVAWGWARENPMPGVPLTFGAANLLALAFALSALGQRITNRVSLRALLLFQVFRLPLEWVLHIWAGEGLIPETMTWTGQNWDIVSPVVFLLAAWIPEVPGLLGSRRAWAWAANAVGFALLVNVGRVAVMSSPLPFAWAVEPKLQLIFFLPYAWIGPVCVGGALAGHVLLTRALLHAADPSQKGEDPGST